MAVAIDANSAALVQSSAGVTVLDTTSLITIGGSANALVVMLWFTANISALTVNWDSAGANQAMTLIGTFAGGSGVDGTGRQYMYALRAPTTGAGLNLHVAWTTATDVEAYGVSFTGVEQSNDANAFKNYAKAGSAGTPSSPAAVTVTTSSANDIALCMKGIKSNVVTTPNQTVLFNTNPSSSTDFKELAAWGQGASSVAFSATLGTTSNWTANGFAIVASVATDTLMPMICM